MFSPIILNHVQRYPEMQIQDVYKPIHQAALGSEHAVSDPAAGIWLEREFKEIGMGPDEPLLDSTSPDEEIVRVHLRPYRAMKGDKEALLCAFICTANEFPWGPTYPRNPLVIRNSGSTLPCSGHGGIYHEDERKGLPCCTSL